MWAILGAVILGGLALASSHERDQVKAKAPKPKTEDELRLEGEKAAEAKFKARADEEQRLQKIAKKQARTELLELQTLSRRAAAGGSDDE